MSMNFILWSQWNRLPVPNMLYIHVEKKLSACAIDIDTPWYGVKNSTPSPCTWSCRFSPTGRSATTGIYTHSDSLMKTATDILLWYDTIQYDMIGYFYMCSTASWVQTTGVHGPCPRAVFTYHCTREHGCPKWRPCLRDVDTACGHDPWTRVSKNDTRVHGPWTLASFWTSVFTVRRDGPRTWVVCTELKSAAWNQN